MSMIAPEAEPRTPHWTTARDVARLAGVSSMTVSNVLNHPTRVTPETAAKVAEAIVALDFHPTDAARRLRTGGSRVLGVVVSDLRDPELASAARAISEVAATLGLLALLTDSRRAADNEQRHVQVFVQQQARAVLVLPVDGSARTRPSATTGVPVRFVPEGTRAIDAAVRLLGEIRAIAG